ncbi:MAG: glycosyltransferase family 4 protein [Candidatus Phytoplasma sp.]|nr:glycosyltransferase family 4 protein [Phytoplasma sp.]
MEEKKITIGLFTDSYLPMLDGVVMVVHNYAIRLAQYANVIVFAPKLKKEFDDSKLPFKVVRCKTWPLPLVDYRWPKPSLDKKFREELENIHLDVVHIHSAFGIGKEGVKYAQKHQVPIISTLHSQHKRDFLERTHSRLFTHLVMKNLIKTLEQTDEKYAVNDKVADLYKEYGLKEKPGVLNNATDMRLVTDLTAVEKLKELHGIKDEKILLFVGRIDKIKNIPFILEVLKDLRQRQFPFKMLFIGGGKYFEKFKQTVSEYKLDEQVILVGKVYDRDLLAQYYRLANLFVFPSTYDASSLVQIEAASQKTPTIFAKDSITSSTVIPDVNGYSEELVVDKFAKKIVDIFSDEHKYLEVCEKAYEEVYIHWDDQVRKVYNHYLDLHHKNIKK